jgi:lysyl-tRNA synthetase, class II
MAQIDEIKKARLDKLEAFKDPYPLSARRTHEIQEVIKGFVKISKLEKEIFLVGRIRSKRGHGGVMFVDIEDGTGLFQLFFKKDHLGKKKFEEFTKLYDIGDFIQVRGDLFKTKKKEKSLLVIDFKILSKSLLPLPEKWHGIQDVEDRFRKRYLDLLFNKEVREKFVLRHKIVQALRDFLIDEGFIEVETPILQTIYGGAKARPFKTKMNALDLNLYLRIAPELYLKELLVGGFEKVFEIGRNFRNEGMDKSHNPEFTALEFYWAYADYKDLMNIVERMFSYVVKKVFKTTKIEFQGKTIDFKSPWKRIDFYQLIKKETKIDLAEIHPDALARKAKEMGIQIDKGEGIGEIADKIYKKYCRDKIIQPTFLIHHPHSSFPLAKPKDELKLANVQPIIGGWEMANGFSELNDPIIQRERFEEQEKMLKQGYEEGMKKDENFLEALEYGMPPAAGFGLGVDRFVSLLTDSETLREIILFPTMKPKK